MRHIYYLLSLGILLTLTESNAIDCPEGYKSTKGKCTDEDECENDACGENARCVNTVGSHYCYCKQGFTPTRNFTVTDGIECEVFNECVDRNIDCGPKATCENSAGGHSCTCESGYIPSNGTETFIAGQGINCIDRDECADPSTCGINAICHNTAGHFYCICAAGFSLKSGETNFTDLYESCMSVCDIDKSICGEGGVCRNSKDGHECVCRSGFTNYGQKQMKCTDINECVDQSIDCGPNAKCVNTERGYSCTCESGYMSSNGKEMFIAGQGIQCIGCEISYSNFCI